MFKIKLLSIFLFATNALATQNIFVPVGERILLEGPGPFHFSSKEGVSVFAQSKPAFFTTSKSGFFEFYQKQRKHHLFSLTPYQLQFYTRVKPLIGNLENIVWGFQKETLLLTSTNLAPEIRSFLIKSCRDLSNGEVLIDFKPKRFNQEVSSDCRKRLRPKSERKIRLVVTESSKSRQFNFGAGIPPSIGWGLEGGSKLKFAEQSGALNLNRGRVNSKGDVAFTSTLSEGNPVIFETGTEVGIQSQGFFNRQATEWKKATTNISVEMLKSNNDETKIKLTLDKKSRTAQGLIFEVEKLSKSVFLKNNVWQKVLDFQGKDESKGRNGILGLGLTGSSNKTRSRTNKEIWVLVSQDD